MEFDPRILMFVVFGAGLTLAVTLERWLARYWLSLPILYVAVGFAVWSLPLGLPHFNPTVDGFDAITLEYATEFIVIASLMAAGIAIDRPVSWANWRQIWPLLLIAMPLTIAAVALLGWWALGLAPASAILLGAALAPTDPVLARSVQVGPPGEDQRHDVRFSLTVEAGLNDGFAFPFTYLAIAAVGMTALGDWTLEWAALDLVWRIVAGCAVGYAVGRIGAWYVFEREADAPIEDIDEASDEAENPSYSTSEGLIVLGTLLLAYGLAELAEGYGFLAVFVGAVTARQRENRSRYHKISHHFIDQIEQIVLVAVLFGFGAMLASGVLSALTWPAALVGLALIFVIRPISGLLAEANCDLPMIGKLAVAFLGVRGMGSIYYLAYGQNNANFAQIDLLWATVSFAILVSIIVHGVVSGPLIRHVEDRRAHVHAGQDTSMAALSPDAPRRRSKAD
ncbi:sodium hydrogen exchanger [Qipengyuania citrea LAMA 915]|uniref:Sodium hydrogen exchanger n=1 Tax=Qipengyuania citrea LAMA 915 TaxID=1306953 RepID=A0A0L1KCD0_9SPHN|nr:cation:proton antiporter [Qipengyuania citrea]KNH01539.1 sodium hydrogen exchanger [Qipengyuania citrea LAMA 915]MCZ4264746.1 cation:proton antiporter [Erythrobacter sp. G21629-S1]